MSHPPAELRILYASSSPCDFREDQLLRGLSNLPNVHIRSLNNLDSERLQGAVTCNLTHADLQHEHAAHIRSTIKRPATGPYVAELCEWADILVVVPIDANSLARMLHGMTDDLLLEVVRSWNVTKRILLAPGMSALMWENPMTKR